MPQDLTLVKGDLGTHRDSQYGTSQGKGVGGEGVAP